MNRHEISSTILALGPKGSNGHEVAQMLQESHFKGIGSHIRLLPSHPEILKNLEECISQEEEGRAKKWPVIKGYAVVPIENSTGGLVEEVIKFWLNKAGNTRVRIVDEIIIPIQHHLLAQKTIDVEDVHKILSHPQAFLQCNNFLSNLTSVRQPTTSTAKAAQMVSWSKSRKPIAAIASAFAAEIYGLKILKENIHDYASNTTKFHVLCGTRRQHESGGKSKSVILFRAKNEPGGLVNVLLPLEEAGANISSLHSIPLGNMGEFAFYCEIKTLLTDTDETRPRRLVKEMQKHCTSFEILGSFPV